MSTGAIFVTILVYLIIILAIGIPLGKWLFSRLNIESLIKPQAHKQNNKTENMSMKKRASAGIYCSPEFGYIITSTAPEESTGIRRVINPVITISYKDSIGFLGSKIIEALHTTKNAQPINSEDAVAINFWQVTGSKSWTAFSKKFRCISIEELDDRLEIIEWKRVKGGAYMGSKDDEGIFLELSSTPEQIGGAVAQIVSYGYALTQ